MKKTIPMQLQTLPSESKCFTGITLYLLSNMKSSARQAARRAGLSLSRHIESLLLGELDALSIPLNRQTHLATPFATRHKRSASKMNP
jgi:hypothetical protein